MSGQPRSPFLLASIAAHIVLVVAIIVASIVTPGVLPVPRDVLAFPNLARAVRLDDVELPAQPRRTAGARDNSAPSTQVVQARSDAAPVTPPSGITAETGNERDVFERPGNLSAIEQGAGAVDGTGLFAVPAPPAPPVARPPVRMHAGITAPLKTVHVAPRYPEIAQATRTQGVVILEVIIDERGHVGDVRVLRPSPLLDQAAVAAVRQWKFLPARLNGEVIPVVMTVTVNFALDR